MTNPDAFTPLTHFSCFSGIGGIDLAAEWAGFQTVGQVELQKYPYQILCKHWPDVPKWRDITNVNGDEVKAICGNITLISGGFPCQPHSVAGKRGGSCDERNLWPELRRIIGETKPKWFLGENVPGLLSSNSGQFFAGVLRDLAEMGYNVGWGSYEAARVGAWHRRMRTFIVAHSDNTTTTRQREYSREVLSLTKPEGPCLGSTSWIYPHTNSKRCKEFNSPPCNQKQGFNTWVADKDGSQWSNEPNVDRMADGIPSRVDRIRCLGNAVVPQQVLDRKSVV